jgi:DNA-binding beta-propeller fold protein YncE
MKVSYRIVALTALVSAGVMPAVTATGTAWAGPAAAVFGHAVSRAAGARSAAPGSRLWVARYDRPPAAPSATASAVAASPDGTTVFVTGEAGNGSQGSSTHWATVAYGATTGRKLWGAEYRQARAGINYAFALAVSPDGSKVFVVGRGAPAAGGSDYVTVAYNAATGEMLWIARYADPQATGQFNEASSVAVSPDGSSVFVTGVSSLASGTSGAATIGYAAATGTMLWVTRYDSPAQGAGAGSVKVSPDGTKVYVAGGVGNDFLTLAYDAATGSQLWVRRYQGHPGNGTAVALAVSPDGSKIFVTGDNGNEVPPGQDYVTLAYAASTGTRLWLRRYRGPGGGDDLPRAIGVSPDGSAVFVTGQIHGPSIGYHYGTVAYNTSTGATLWTAVRSSPGLGAGALAVNPDGSTVYVTGTNFVGPDKEKSDYVTVAYDAATGAVRWLQYYGGRGQTNEAASLAVSPDGGKVFVTGFSQVPTTKSASHWGYATVAYSG